MSTVKTAPVRPLPVAPPPAPEKAPAPVPVEAPQPTSRGDRIALTIWVSCALLMAALLLRDLFAAVLGW